MPSINLTNNNTQYHSFLTSDVLELGVGKAAILSSIRFWLRYNAQTKKSKNQKDGYIWTFSSAEELKKLMPYLGSRAKISKMLRELEASGHLIANNFNSHKRDRTKWYTTPDFTVRASLSHHKDDEKVKGDFYFDTDIAAQVGIERAVILNKIQFWSSKNEDNSYFTHEGTTWISSTRAQLAKQFSWMNKHQVGYAMNKLELHGYIQSGNHHKTQQHRGKWYSITPQTTHKEVYEKRAMQVIKTSNASDKNEQPLPVIDTYIDSNRINIKQEQVIPSPAYQDITIDIERFDKPFDDFYNAGLSKARYKEARVQFIRQCELSGLTPVEFADKLINDIQQRLANCQFGFDNQQPLNYLIKQRWTQPYVDHRATITNHAERKERNLKAALSDISISKLVVGTARPHQMIDLNPEKNNIVLKNKKLTSDERKNYNINAALADINRPKKITISHDVDVVDTVQECTRLPLLSDIVHAISAPEHLNATRYHDNYG